NDRYDAMHGALIADALRRREGYRQQKARADEAKLRLAEMKANAFQEDREYERDMDARREARADAYLNIARQNAARGGGGSRSALSMLRDRIINGEVDPSTLSPEVRRIVLGGGPTSGGTFG